jgi:hypothetical protein
VDLNPRSLSAEVRASSSSIPLSKRFLAKMKKFLNIGRRVAIFMAVMAITGSTIDHLTRLITSYKKSVVSVRVLM